MFNEKQFAVLGLGRFGRSIVRTLFDNGYEVMACDIDPEIVQETSDYATYVVQVDVRDESAVKALGLGNFDVVIIAIGVDVESSVMATLIAKESGAKHVIAKAQNQIQKKILERIGADRVILPEWEMGVKLATNLISSNIIDFINLSDEFGIAEIEPLEEWYNLTLHKSNIRANTGLNIVAIKRDKRIIVSPMADDVIMTNDILVVIGSNSDLNRLSYKKKRHGGFFD